MSSSSSIPDNRPPPAESLSVRVITPTAGVGAFREAIESLVHGNPQARMLAWRMFLRDVRAAYRQSMLGYVWMLLPPIASTLVWVFLNGQNVVSINTGEIPYPLFVLVGTILWTAFNAAVMSSLGMIGEAKNLLSKVNFPHEALVMVAFGKALLDAIIPVLLLIPMLFLYPINWSPLMLLFPVALLGALLFGLSLGLILVPLAALYSDIGRGMQLLLRFGFFLAPVIYPLPAAGPGRTLISLNPLTPIIVSGREWLVGGDAAMTGAFTLVFGGTLLLIAIGLLLFKVALPHLIERIGS